MSVCLACNVQATDLFKTSQDIALRAPSVPLITSDTYLAIWSPYNELNEGNTEHWTAATHPLLGALRVDGKVYRFMGKDKENLEVILPMTNDERWEAKYTLSQPASSWMQAHPEIKLTGAPETWFGAVTENDSGRVETVSVAGTDIEGTEMRRIFSLRSACFTLTADAESVTFRVTGYGHGVGMSQYGAEQLAKAGKTWQEILAWYYTGVTIGPAG